MSVDITLIKATKDGLIDEPTGYNERHILLLQELYENIVCKKFNMIKLAEDDYYCNQVDSRCQDEIMVNKLYNTYKENITHIDFYEIKKELNDITPSQIREFIKSKTNLKLYSRIINYFDEYLEDDIELQRQLDDRLTGINEILDLCIKDNYIFYHLG